MDEDHRKKQSSLDLLSVLATLPSLNGCRRLFHRAISSVAFGRLLMDSEQPASSYRFPVGGMSSDILTDIDDSFIPFFRHALEPDVTTPAVSRSP